LLAETPATRSRCSCRTNSIPVRRSQLVAGHQNEPSDLANRLGAPSGRWSPTCCAAKIVTRPAIRIRTNGPQACVAMVGLRRKQHQRRRARFRDQSSIQQRHPDLMWVPDPQARLRQPMVRRNRRLLEMNPSADKTSHARRHPRFRRRSAAVRRATDSLEKGDWPAAERIGKKRSRNYPATDRRVDQRLDRGAALSGLRRGRTGGSPMRSGYRCVFTAAKTLAEKRWLVETATTRLSPSV